MRRLLDYDPMFGISTFHEFDPVTKETHVIYEYDDVGHVLDWNQVRQNDGSNGYNKDRSWKHVAHIPMAVINKWLIEDGFDFYAKDDDARLKKLLNDPDYRKLRTGLGTV
jgi:hypothetical protein